MTAFQWGTIFTTEWGMGPISIPTANDPQSYRLIRRLVDQGADLNQADVAGRVALHYAAAKLDDDGVALLAELGADLTIQDEQGYSAGWTACEAYLNTQVTSGDNFKTSADRIQQIVP
jgi:hypothetical protein